MRNSLLKQAWVPSASAPIHRSRAKANDVLEEVAVVVDVGDEVAVVVVGVVNGQN